MQKFMTPEIPVISLSILLIAFIYQVGLINFIGGTFSVVYAILINLFHLLSYIFTALIVLFLFFLYHAGKSAPNEQDFKRDLNLMFKRQIRDNKHPSTREEKKEKKKGWMSWFSDKTEKHAMDFLVEKERVNMINSCIIKNYVFFSVAIFECQGEELKLFGAFHNFYIGDLF